MSQPRALLRSAFLKTKPNAMNLSQRLVAHRGATNDVPNSTLAHLPENTLHSMREAYGKGALIVECDIHHTQDDKIIVLHDDTLRRTATFNEKLAKTLSHEKFMTLLDTNVAELSYEEVLKQVDVGAYAWDIDEKYHGCPIPLLKDFLLELKDNPQCKLIIEIKTAQEKVVHLLANLIKQCKADYHLQDDQLIFISFDFNLIKKSKSMLSQYKHLFLTTATPDDNDAKFDPIDPTNYIGLYFRIGADLEMLSSIIKMVKNAKLDGIDFEFDSQMDAELFVAKIRENALLSAVWSYPKDDNLPVARRMLATGIEYINTNQPEFMFSQLQWIREKKYRFPSQRLFTMTNSIVKDPPDSVIRLRR